MAIRCVTDYSTWDDEKMEFAAPVLGLQDSTAFRPPHEKVSEAYVCLKCGGDRFHVGHGPHLTVLKCPDCGWTQVVHDG